MKRFLGLLPLFLLLSCAKAGGVSEGSEGETSRTFPSSLAVTSPLELSSSSPAALVLKGTIASYGSATDDIEAILNGTSTADCDFDAALFLATETNALCYGPSIEYEDHPDYAGAPPPAPQEDGTLPIGDLGIWQEIEPDGSSEACAAAQLNARMNGISNKANAALQSMASLVCVANNNGLDPSPTNSTLDLTTEMNDMATTSGLSIVFGTASITHSDSSGRDEFTYAIEMTYTSGTDSYDIAVDLLHVPGCGDEDYEGRLSYQFNDTATLGNCLTPPAASADVTRAGSLLYRKYSDTALTIDARNATYCAHDADAFTEGLVDPSKKFDPVSDPDGWGDDFNRFIGNLDPSSMGGQYAFAWQAGRLDGNTRIFNIFLEEDPPTGLLSGAAFFGFGSDIAATDGSASRIGGFICNWAGPGADHTLAASAQAQYIEEDPTLGVFASDAATLAITYAPVNGCDYDGTGTFVYDKDDDGDLTDEDPALAVVNDLAALTDIEDSGFLLPVAPSNVDPAACTSERLYVGTGEYNPSDYWDGIFRIENAEDIDSDVSGVATTPDATVPVKSVSTTDGIQDADGVQLNFVHSIYVWEDRDEMFLGSLFTNADNSVTVSRTGRPLNTPNLQVGSIGVIANASSADGTQTMTRHLFAFGGTVNAEGGSTEIHQPHGVWVDESRDILYGADSFSGEIAVFDGASTANTAGGGTTTGPDRTVSHTNLGNPIHAFVDEANDRMFVASTSATSGSACAMGGRESIVAVYNNASTIDGAVDPHIRLVGCNTRLMIGNNTTHNVWFNSSNNMLIVGHHTNEVLFYDLSAIDLTSTTPTDYDLAPARVLEIHEQTDDSDLGFWSVYGLFYLASKDRLYVSTGYNDPAVLGGAPDTGAPPNEIKVYDGVSLSHVDGQLPPTRVIHWDNGGTYYPPQPLWVTEY